MFPPGFFPLFRKKRLTTALLAGRAPSSLTQPRWKLYHTLSAQFVSLNVASVTFPWLAALHSCSLTGDNMAGVRL